MRISRGFGFKEIFYYCEYFYHICLVVILRKVDCYLGVSDTIPRMELVESGTEPTQQGNVEQLPKNLAPHNYFIAWGIDFMQAPFSVNNEKPTSAVPTSFEVVYEKHEIHIKFLSDPDEAELGKEQYIAYQVQLAPAYLESDQAGRV
jgi:hypothetical protein